MKPDLCAKCGEPFLPGQRLHLTFESGTFHQACLVNAVQITEADVRRAVGELFTHALGGKEDRLVLTSMTDWGGWTEKTATARLCDLLGLKETTDDAKV